jgi:UDP-N-acetylmuramoylalanine--D-glutamate ligase
MLRPSTNSCYDRLVWIAGGQGKAGGIAALAPFFPRIAGAVLIGRDAPDFAATLAAAGVPHRIAGTLEAAVPEALATARRTGAPVVLLSPAAASFDQFSGFEARGARFAALARALPDAEAA